jgi:hypothetical protein
VKGVPRKCTLRHCFLCVYLVIHSLAYKLAFTSASKKNYCLHETGVA